MMMTPEKWAYARRQALTLCMLAWAILGVVVIALHIADNEWPSPFTALSCPLWWWWAIRRIATDVLNEARDDALRTIEKHANR